MRLAAPALFALVFGAAALAQQPQYLSGTVNVPSGSLGYSVVTEDGQAFLSLLDPLTSMQDVYLDGVNISNSVLGSQRSAVVAGLVNGNYAWYGFGSATGGTGRPHVYLNTLDYSAQVLGTVYSASAVAYTAGGLAWHGKKTSAGPQDAYKNSTTYSTGLGSTRTAVADGINDLGTLLWHGTGSSTGGNQDVYVNSTNYSAPLLTGYRNAYGAGINNAGTIVWTGRGTNTGYLQHAFKNAVDYSGQVVGSAYTAKAFGIDDAGHMAWIQYGPPNALSDVWVDAQNMSAALGTNRQAVPFEISPRGDLLWSGSGDNLPYGVQDVFVNQFNLSAAVLGSNRGTSEAVAISRYGWVIWQVPVDGATWATIVSMPATKTVTGKLDPELYAGCLTCLPATVRVIQSHSQWDLGDVPLMMDSAGNFSVNLPEGSFDLTFGALHYLGVKVAGVDTRTSTPIPGTIALLGGDADGNNVVDLLDLADVLGDFNGCQCDLNGDGKTNLFDIVLVLANFGAHGDG